VRGAAFRAMPILEATQGQMDGFFSQLTFTCHLEEVASVGDLLEICSQPDSRVVGQRDAPRAKERSLGVMVVPGSWWEGAWGRGAGSRVGLQQELIELGMRLLSNWPGML